MSKRIKKGIDFLSDLSGISSEVIKEIAIAVMENNKKLNSCSKHQFDSIVGTRKWECSNCHGTVSSMNKIWYEKGIEHQKFSEGEIKCP